jgi:hypothetical protein
MKTSLTRIYRGMFALAVVSALGFGATQAVAAPTAPKKVVATDCTTCAMQCVEIRLCYPGYCQCAW